MGSVNPVNVGVHVGLDFAHIEVVQLLEDSHGKSSISRPMIIVRSSRGTVIRSSNDSSLSTDVDVLHEEVVHSLEVI